MNIQRSNMKKLYFTIIALMATLVAGAQTIKVYEYNEKGELNTTPSYISSKKVKVVFADDDHECVDLALPSGTLWATCNVGANSPEEYGDYFAWGETTSKDIYGWSTYKWCEGSINTMTKYCTIDKSGTVDGKKELDPEDDAATANWGRNWCMPSYDQIVELYDPLYTTTEWTTLNDVYGRKITSRANGKSIFLPAAGVRTNGTLNNIGTIGYYLSRVLSGKSSSSGALYLYLDSDKITYYQTQGNRCYGLSVRPVRCKK